MNASHLRIPRWWLAACLLLALGVRVWRLAWQPLWWDEGYSIYFATEPLAHMVWLTAHDIHPPLYYALLHITSNLAGNAAPLTMRLLSVLVGALSAPLLLWLGWLLFPGRTRTVWIAALLISLNPMHLFYSQEVRMYALAMLLAIGATALLWLAAQRLRAGAPALLPLAGYVLLATLLLYTLYYGAFLLLAHALWGVWRFWRARRALAALLAAWLATGLAYLPWLLYALPKLIAYVAQKVDADQDQPLSTLTYLTRHARAFLVGNVEGAYTNLAWIVALVAVVALVILLILAIRKPPIATDSSGNRESGAAALRPVWALTLFTLAPVACAFVVNLRLPFFPEGGERLLLIVLPFLMLLLAKALDRMIACSAVAGWLTSAAFVAVALLGIFTFYTTPRHVDEDYRPLLRDVVQHSRDQDTLIAIFPWQVGYTRAYFPATIGGPRVHLLGDFAVEYGAAVEEALADALTRGSIWFPEPLAFGSSLPEEMEAWLIGSAANLENKWYSPTTRLTAWADLAAPAPLAQGAHFAGATLVGAGVAQAALPADNTPLPILLEWEIDPTRTADLGVTLRLLDAQGRTWAARDYAPIASLARMEPAIGAAERANARLGLPIPPGTPPDVYTLHVGVTRGETLVQPEGADTSITPLLPLGAVTVTLPAQPATLERLAMGTRLPASASDSGLTLLGYTTPQEAVLAGTELAITLFARSEVANPPLRALHVRLESDSASSEWQGWSLPAYPTTAWQQGHSVTIPVAMPLPPDLAEGRYRLTAAWVAPDTGAAGAAIRMGSVEVARRTAHFAYLAPAHELAPAPQLGTHALLRGYSLTRTHDPAHDPAHDTVALQLMWEVLQPLLPPHNIFVHALAADDVSGAPLAQQDGAPQTTAGSAPTGTWQPGEFLTTEHLLQVAADQPIVLRVGLYEPASQVRLPVTLEGAPAGDAVLLGE